MDDDMDDMLGSPSRFDRADVVQAYAALERDYNPLPRRISVRVQLERMLGELPPSCGWKDALNDNALSIYLEYTYRHGLDGK